MSKYRYYVRRRNLLFKQAVHDAGSVLIWSGPLRWREVDAWEDLIGYMDLTGFGYEQTRDDL